jgi:hypothetical protein
MDPVAARRKNVAFVINQNPTEIFINRTEKIKSGGGFEEKTTILNPITVRIFMQATRDPQIISSLPGTKQVDKKWGLLADYLADIKEGPNVRDEFDAPEGHFVVKAVSPQYVREQLVALQCDLEKVT